MKRKFLTNLILLIFLNLLIKPFWFLGIDRNIQNIVGTEEYGFYFSMLNFSLLFNIILDLGISNFSNRDVSKNPVLFREYFSNIVIVRLLLALLYAIVCLTLAFLLGYEKRQTNLLVILIVNQFLASFMLYLRSNISSLQFYTTDSILSILDRAFMIILCSLAIWGHALSHPFTIKIYVYIQTLSYSISILIIALVLWRKSRNWTFSFHPQKAMLLFRKCLPFAMLGFLMSCYYRFDGIMLERLLPNGKIDAGIYAQSFRILEAASNFSVLFATLLLPMFSRMLGTSDDVIPLVRTSFTLMFVASAALSIIGFAFGKPLIQLLYDNGNDYSASVFSILILSFIPVSISYIFGTLLTANGSLTQLNYVALAGVFINFFLNLILIPSYKAIGAAVASLVTQTSITLAQIFICKKKWNLKTHIPEIVRFILFVLLSIGTTILVTHLPAPLILNIAAAGLLICLLALATGILHIKQISNAIKLQMRKVEG